MKDDRYCPLCGRRHDGKHGKYCRKHQSQIEKYGKALDCDPRTKFDPNEFVSRGDGTFEFYTYKAPTFCKDRTYVIDACDVLEVSRLHWRSDRDGYATAGDKSMRLHRLITKALPGQQVDHVNGDVTDNRRSNLRIADNSLNQLNKKPYNTLGVKGVCEHRNGRFSAYLRIGGKAYHSMCLDTIEEAAFARFVLEQMFVGKELKQYSLEAIERCSEKDKKRIIDGLRLKFGK